MAKGLLNHRKAAKEFAVKWCGRGDEKQDTQVFWTSLLRDVFGVANPEDSIQFEKRIKLGHTSFIDAYIPETKVLIEQKSIDVDLRKEARQSDGTLLTPYRQAKRYADEMPNSLRPSWIVVCNFREFLIYDMEKPHDEPVQVLLEELPDKFECLQFMVNYKKTSVSPEEQISLKAGELVGKLYDALYKEYINPDESSLRSLNILCVRIVFCLYAEDAGLFETRTAFEDYIKSFSAENLRRGIMDLFKILNTKPENRDKYDTKINSFPYVNGGLFAADDIEIPNFTKEIVDVIVNFCAPFDWSKISPTIFGAVFESTLNPETRRKGGMHYTSIENIHKVIDPLFMDDLRSEFCEIMGIYSPSKIEGVSAKADGGVCGFSHTPQSLRDSSPNLGEQFRSCKVSAKTKKRLEQFRNKLASLTFLDPACGSGNFLTETYISLRRLENEILKIIYGSQMFVGHGASPIKVKISQFYGIEINDFAVTVAKTALWIAESQMMKETEEIVNEDIDFLPLSTSATIVEGNALRVDWRYLREEAEVPTIKAKKTNLIYPMMVKEKEVEYGEINLVTDEISVGKTLRKQEANHYDYIMGNPPFVGQALRTKEQAADMQAVFAPSTAGGKLDYVAGWYKKASDLMKETDSECAFVSSNSICQGESVNLLWKDFLANGIFINFAHSTFKWTSESTDAAAVMCVVVGFSYKERKEKLLFASEQRKIVSHINGYLTAASDVFIKNRSKSINAGAATVAQGSPPADGGKLLMTAAERENFIKKYPELEAVIKPCVGSKEFINDTSYSRFCFWFADVKPSDFQHIKELRERFEYVHDFRLKSPVDRIQKTADKPYLFTQNRQPKTDYLIIPRTSSSKRRYIPIGFLPSDVIVSDAAVIVYDATLYEFGLISSNVHNSWMRMIAGRLKDDYRYAPSVWYNFPLPTPTKAQKEAIQKSAQGILNARKMYPNKSLADMYGQDMYLFPELLETHKENDKTIMQAYGFNPKMTEAEIVAELFKMYEKLTEKK